MNFRIKKTIPPCEAERFAYRICIARTQNECHHIIQILPCPFGVSGWQNGCIWAIFWETRAHSPTDSSTTWHYVGALILVQNAQKSDLSFPNRTCRNRRLRQRNGLKFCVWVATLHPVTASVRGGVVVLLEHVRVIKSTCSCGDTTYCPLPRQEFCLPNRNHRSLQSPMSQRKMQGAWTCTAPLHRTPEPRARFAVGLEETGQGEVSFAARLLKQLNCRHSSFCMMWR